MRRSSFVVMVVMPLVYHRSLLTFVCLLRYIRCEVCLTPRVMRYVFHLTSHVSRLTLHA